MASAGWDSSEKDLPEPAVHRAIVCVDVESFGDRRRTNPPQLAVREGLYAELERVFAFAGIGWRHCYHEDRGDGVLILVPPQVPKDLLVSGVWGELAAALAGHNRDQVPEARIRLRVAIHAGEVHHDTHGVAGAAINMAFRLLEARPLKLALARSAGVLAVIASHWFYEEVIRHTPAGRPGTYRKVDVTVKETTAGA